VPPLTRLSIGKYRQNLSAARMSGPTFTCGEVSDFADQKTNPAM